MARLNDPAVVGREYASPDRLAARARVYGGGTGGGAAQVVFDAVAETAPARILEVGCGPGELAARLDSELSAEVFAVDASPQMAELARRRGVDASLGDAQALAFAAGTFDCVVAAWVLYHLPDVSRGLSELRRVLCPGGRLVAATTGADHLRELWALVGRDRAGERPIFRGDNGERVLRRHFDHVEAREVRGEVLFGDHHAARAYVANSITAGHLASRLPAFEGPLRARRSAVVYVAS